MKLIFLVLAIATVSYGATTNLKNYFDSALYNYNFQEEQEIAAPPAEEAAAAEPAAEEPAVAAEEPAAAGEPAAAEEPALAPEAPVEEPVEAPVAEPELAPEAPIEEPTYAPAPIEEAPIEEAPVEAESAYGGEPIEAEPTFGERLDEQAFTTTSAPAGEALEQPAANLNELANDPQVRDDINLGIATVLEAGRNANGVPLDVNYTFESLDNLVDLENTKKYEVTLTDGGDRRIYAEFNVLVENGQSRVVRGCIKVGKFVRV